MGTKKPSRECGRAVVRGRGQRGVKAADRGCCKGGLEVAAGTELGGIIIGEDGVDKGGGKVAAALATFNDNLGDVAQGLHGVLALADMNEADGSGDDACGMELAFAHEVADLEEGCGGIADDIEGVGIFLGSQLHSGLAAGDGRPLPRPLSRERGEIGDLFRAWVVDVAVDFDAEALQGALADAGSCHGDIGNDMLEATVSHLVI